MLGVALRRLRPFLIIACVLGFLVVQLFRSAHDDPVLMSFDRNSNLHPNSQHETQIDPIADIESSIPSSHPLSKNIEKVVVPHIDTPNSVPSADSHSPDSSKKSIAISTTILSPDSNFPVWLDYHLRIVDLVMIFMDDPERKPLFESFIQGKPVILFTGSTAAPQLTAASRLILRQDENNNAALAYALQHNITWLMHIDTDEIFYEDGYHNWTALEGVGVISFTNHESIPLRHTPVNPFAECTLFKISAGELPFMAYGNGKAAVRVTPGVQSDGPHQFRGYEGEERYLSRPMILHYPTPSYDIWVSKYSRYGNFSDYWYDDPSFPNDLTFMLESRDHVQRALQTGNWDDAKKFFDKQIPDEETTERLLKSGSLRRITPLYDPLIIDWPRRR